MSRLRVVNLGLPKTGTTTLTRALRRARLSVADWKVRGGRTKKTELIGQKLGVILYEDYYKHHDPLFRLGAFDAFNELSTVGNTLSLWPQTDWALLDTIQLYHPGVKFLLNMRDPLETANSMMRWGNLGHTRLPQASVPGLPNGFGSTEAELARWVEGHYRFCDRVFSGAKNFLAFDIADKAAPEKIGAFLGRDLPWWGRANMGKAAPSEMPAEVINA